MLELHGGFCVKHGDNLIRNRNLNDMRKITVNLQVHWYDSKQSLD